MIFARSCHPKEDPTSLSLMEDKRKCECEELGDGSVDGADERDIRDWRLIIESCGCLVQVSNQTFLGSLGPYSVLACDL
jgi:hypothetical protein